jgi:hypothetical protein
MRIVRYASIAAVALVAVVAVGSVTAQEAKRKSLPLGTLSLVSAHSRLCASAPGCQSFSVRCPGVREHARGALSILRPSGRARGVVLLFSGGHGTEWWAKGIVAPEFLSGLTQLGFVTVQVAWQDSWLGAADGEEAGPARLACRPATVIAWAHAKLYRPLRIRRPASGLARCGFCVTGNSAGASEVSYALTHYGLDRVLDAVIPTGGPPHADMAKGCIRSTENQQFWYPGWAARIMDASYGFRRGSGPCAAGDIAFSNRWREDSIATGGLDYVYPRTRVVFLFGGSDNSGAVPEGRTYAARLRADGSPSVTVRVVRGCSHQFARSSAGLAVLRHILFETPR